MALPTSLPRSVRRASFAALALLALALVLPGLLSPLIAGRLRAMARSRGLELRWQRIAFEWPLTLDMRGLALRRMADNAPLGTAEHVETALGPRAWSLRPRIYRLTMEHIHVTLPAGNLDDDSTATDDDERRVGAGPAAPRVRAAAEQLADALLLPARRLPELRLTDLAVNRGESLFVSLDGLTLTHRSGGVQFAAAGLFAGERHVAFDAVIQWSADDHLSGRASFHMPDATRGRDADLDLHVDGRVTQDPRAGMLRVGHGTRVRVGSIDMRVEGELRRRGPRLSMALELDRLTAREVQRSLPAAVLGPLAGLSCRGSWDWRASLSLDVGEPDSTRFTADVIPHGLMLGPEDSRVPLARLAEPFVAEIHLPHERLVHRDLSAANPHYRPLERISPLLRYALLTNEDGGFYKHRGFNTEAIQLAIAANLRAGAFRRGAGTVTMQLARNLYLGHRRTLSRKGQEVVLAWVLEHLTGLTKDRLLEIYLNIIEWGPDVHGADEAAHYYFDKDAAAVTLDEALFLAVVVPSPTRWNSRLDAAGDLRPWARSQMAFIARKMVSRGWLAPDAVPTAEALHVTLRGPAAGALALRDRASL